MPSVYRCHDPNHKDKMQNKKAVQVIIWIIVVAMVIGLLFSVLAVL